MKSQNVLFVTHKYSQCGVYEFGNDVYNAIKSSSKYNFILAECDNIEELEYFYKEYEPVAIIYNYQQGTMRWIIGGFKGRILKHSRLIKHNISHFPVPQIGIIHEVTQKRADSATQSDRRGYFVPGVNTYNSFFDYYIAADPSLLLGNPYVFKTGRVIPKYENNYPVSNIPIISSAGFGGSGKGFEKIVQLVQEEFNYAEIRINIPYADHGDKEGVLAKQSAEDCRKQLYKDGVKLTITHEYWDKTGLLNFLAQSNLNVFLYTDKTDRGISSMLDNALAVNRPVAISDSSMFRHVLDARLSICVNDISLHEIIENGTKPLEKFISEWAYENLQWDYERIITHALNNFNMPKYTKVRQISDFLKATIKTRAGKMPKQSAGMYSKWLRTTDRLYNDDYQNVLGDFHYNIIDLPKSSSLNRILGKDARAIYKPTVDTLFKLVPNTMANKSPDANVNQAFVFDSVHRFMGNYKHPRILCVGSYEDTACMSLIKMGFKVEEIDPMINYSLQDFFTKPTTKMGSYDIIFSTSVIEHDPDDKSFLECVSELLSSGGVFIMTCDYRDGWKLGDPKPGVDARLYTKKDLEYRLLTYLNNCELVDVPDWDCLNPDFESASGNYTFASFVVRKI